jgi:dynein assembly factor 3
MADGIGSINLWGFSPAMDLQEICAPEYDGKEINVLIVGSGDARHALQTMARAHRRARKVFTLFLLCNHLD